MDGCVVEVFATPEATGQYAALAAAAPVWTEVEPAALASLSDSVTPAGLVAVCHFLDVPLADALAGGTALAVLCADVRDPGNAGTVIRTADAFGAGAVVLAGSSVDAYNPKTVRASVGSLFHLPLAVEPDVAAAVAAARTAGLTVLAADGDGEVVLDDADDLLRGPTAWLLRQRGLGPGARGRRGRGPPGPDRPPRGGREPQPRHGRGGLPARDGTRAARRALTSRGTPGY